MESHITHIKGQSAIEYLTTYGWMLLVVAIVGGSIFTTVQGSSQIDADGFDQGNLGFVQSGFTDDGFEMVLRNQEADQMQVKEITLSSEQTGEEVTVKPQETLPVGESQGFSTIGLAEANTRDTVDVSVEYDSGGLDNLVAEGSITGAFSLDPEQAEPGNGDWEFVDVSQVNQSTVDTSSMSDFYIMKYEASRSGNASSGLDYEPVSRQNHIPWANISQNEAINKCQDIGGDLPSNKQWQAASMAEIGNSSTQPLGNTDSGSDSMGDSGIPDSTQSGRVLTGSGPGSWTNSIGVYDLNGNVWEWTSTVVDQSHPMHFGGSDDGVETWSNNGYPASIGSRNPNLGDDFYYSSPDDNRAVPRGGTWTGGDSAGVFSMGLVYSTSYSGDRIGFRCSFS